MDNFEYLNEFLDEMLEKNYITRKNHSKFGNEIIDRSIQLSTIERYAFSDEELEYVMNYLKEKDIYVLGSSPALYTNFDNYRYVVKNGVPRKSIELKKEEQFNLLRKYQETHDIYDRNKVVESYIRMVNSIALKYADITGIDQDELASYGYEGLIVSIENIDLSTNFSSSYFFNMINGYILNGIAQEQGFVFNDQFYLNYVKARKKILQKHEFETISEYDLLEEILEETLKNRKDSEYSQEKSKNKFYNAYSISLEDFEIEESKDEINAVIEREFQKEISKNIRKSLEILSPIQKHNIMLRFGIGYDDPLTLQEVSEFVNISASGVDFSIKRGIKKIRDDKYLLKVLENLNKENNHEYEFNDRRGVSYEKKRRT